MATIASATRQRVLDYQQQTSAHADQIALVLHLSPSTVHRVLRESGQHREHKATSTARQMRAEEAPAVRQLADAGVSPTQICKQLHLGYDTIKLIAAEHDIRLSSGRTGAPSAYNRKIAEVRRLAENGLSQSEIAHRTSTSLPTLTRWLKQAGITIARDPGRTRESGQASNFGDTPEERKDAARRGGEATAESLTEITCLHCQQPFTRGRSGSGRTSRDRYCSPEHAYAHRRENSGKTITATCACGCGEQFLTWASRPKKYLSREHWIKSNRRVPEYGFEGHVIQGGHEAAFIGLCSLRGIRFEFFDRAQAIRWDGEESGYGPDFSVMIMGEQVYVDTKGWQQAPEKWSSFRAQRGLLAILRKEDLDQLFLIPRSTYVLQAIKFKAIEQEKT